MDHADDDRLRPLRAALHQPDRQTWRRHLSLPARAVAGRSREGPPFASPWWREERAAATGDGPKDAADDPETLRSDDGSDRPFPLWQAVAAVLVLAAGVVLGSGWLPVDRRPAAGPDPLPAPSPDHAEVGSPSGGGGLGAEEPPATSATSTSVVRLWPAAEVEVVGREVRTDGGRWDVGADGDVVIVGDWDCDRLPTPAVLRPATGQVVVFDGWAATDEVLRARAVAAVPGAVAIDASTTCGEILVRFADGAEQVVSTATPPGASS